MLRPSTCDGLGSNEGCDKADNTELNFDKEAANTSTNRDSESALGGNGESCSDDRRQRIVQACGQLAGLQAELQAIPVSARGVGRGGLVRVRSSAAVDLRPQAEQDCTPVLKEWSRIMMPKAKVPKFEQHVRDETIATNSLGCREPLNEELLKVETLNPKATETSVSSLSSSHVDQLDLGGTNHGWWPSDCCALPRRKRCDVAPNTPEVAQLSHLAHVLGFGSPEIDKCSPGSCAGLHVEALKAVGPILAQTQPGHRLPFQKQQRVVTKGPDSQSQELSHGVRAEGQAKKTDRVHRDHGILMDSGGPFNGNQPGLSLQDS
mmetsp:Transcript_80339/g.259604  ORF Transcript_80339/g.259604 Transcript_80339/m.259604 type:complete len:320 (-) Transcript_80339:60-1019(-)